MSQKMETILTVFSWSETKLLPALDSNLEATNEAERWWVMKTDVRETGLVLAGIFGSCFQTYGRSNGDMVENIFTSNDKF